MVLKEYYAIVTMNRFKYGCLYSLVSMVRTLLSSGQGSTTAVDLDLPFMLAKDLNDFLGETFFYSAIADFIKEREKIDAYFENPTTISLGLMLGHGQIPTFDPHIFEGKKSMCLDLHYSLGNVVPERFLTFTPDGLVKAAEPLGNEHMKIYIVAGKSDYSYALSFKEKIPEEARTRSLTGHELRSYRSSLEAELRVFVDDAGGQHKFTNLIIPKQERSCGASKTMPLFFSKIEDLTIAEGDVQTKYALVEKVLEEFYKTKGYAVSHIDATQTFLDEIKAKKEENLAAIKEYEKLIAEPRYRFGPWMFNPVDAQYLLICLSLVHTLEGSIFFDGFKNISPEIGERYKPSLEAASVDSKISYVYNVLSKVLEAENGRDAREKLAKVYASLAELSNGTKYQVEFLDKKDNLLRNNVQSNDDIV